MQSIWVGSMREMNPQDPSQACFNYAKKRATLYYRQNDLKTVRIGLQCCHQLRWLYHQSRTRNRSPASHWRDRPALIFLKSLLFSASGGMPRCKSWNQISKVINNNCTCLVKQRVEVMVGRKSSINFPGWFAALIALMVRVGMNLSHNLSHT